MSITLNDGHKVPAIAFGTGSKWKWHDVTSYVEQAIESGFSHLDTAAYYETEEYVGAAIKESGLAREDLFVTTKCGLGIPLRKSLENSLDKLKVDYVDLFLIHNPMFVDDVGKAWREMEGFKEEGLTRSIGVSNYEVKDLRQTLQAVNKFKPAVNQISLNPYNYAKMKPIIEFCQENGIVVEAYSSLAPITTYPGGPVDIPITAAALRLGITRTQVIFLWVRAKGAVVVTTTSNKERMKEYLQVDNLPPLAPEEISAIDNAGSNGPPSKFSLFISSLRLPHSFLSQQQPPPVYLDLEKQTHHEDHGKQPVLRTTTTQQLQLEPVSIYASRKVMFVLFLVMVGMLFGGGYRFVGCM